MVDIIYYKSSNIDNKISITKENSLILIEK